MIPISRVTDVSDHGGVIINSPYTGCKVDGEVVAMYGSMHLCPIPGHGTTPIVSSPITTTQVEGHIIAMIGSVAGCGAKIVTGSSTTKAV